MAIHRQRSESCRPQVHQEGFTNKSQWPLTCRMKRRRLIERLHELARESGKELVFVRHGANQDLYRLVDQLIPIPRDREVKERLARAIIADAMAIVEGDR